MTLVVYRHAAHTTPVWAVPNWDPGRYHRRGQIAQYFSLHPLGPAAEIMRRQLRSSWGQAPVGDVILNLWVIRVPDEGIIDISFDTCTGYGVTPEELVADNYTATQDLGDRLRADGVTGIKVPSAALSGTDNLVLFGPKVADDYLAEPVQPEELPTGHLTDYAHPPEELWPWVRPVGKGHWALENWHSTGMYEPFHDPIPGEPPGPWPRP